MKRTLILILIFACSLIAIESRAGDPAAGLEKIKALAGSWQGKADGKTVKVSYEVVSNGSAVMERMQREGEPEMITMYHADGENLMMTHYCSAMNQPRMRAEVDGNEIHFSLIDITNLASAEAGHMAEMILTIKDAETINHSWKFRMGDQIKSDPFDLKRVRMTSK